jgi:hypothetical protein
MVGAIDIDIALAALLGFLGGRGPIKSEVMTEVAKRTASAQVLRREMLENVGVRQDTKEVSMGSMGSRGMCV